ncbi:hypothetical protein ACSBR2_000664 [Camellia fascicularis]
MAIEFCKGDVARHAYSGQVCSGSRPPKPKLTPLSCSPSSSAAVISSISSPPSPIVVDLSLLFEACGRTVNTVNGALGLLLTRNWNICEAAVETVLAGGTLRPFSTGVLTLENDEAFEAFHLESLKFQK